MLDWARRYVDVETGSIGGLRHGTFYAVCQAIFVVFCFRYKQFIASDGMRFPPLPLPSRLVGRCGDVAGTNEMKRWNIGHLVHSRLNPLAFVNRNVALCFASICRSAPFPL